MPSAAYGEASRYCVRRRAVVDADCWFNSLYIRAVPSHAFELAAVYLDRSVAAVLAYGPDMKASPQERQDLAAFIDLCGAGPAGAFVRPWLPGDGRRALRRSPRHDLPRQGQCDEAAVF